MLNGTPSPYPLPLKREGPYEINKEM